VGCCYEPRGGKIRKSSIEEGKRRKILPEKKKTGLPSKKVLWPASHIPLEKKKKGKNKEGAAEKEKSRSFAVKGEGKPAWKLQGGTYLKERTNLVRKGKKEAKKKKWLEEKKGNGLRLKRGRGGGNWAKRRSGR